MLLLKKAKPKCPRVSAVIADAGCTGFLKQWMKCALGWDLLLVKRPRFKRCLFGKEIVMPGMATEEKKGFPILPRRRVVERTFAKTSQDLNLRHSPARSYRSGTNGKAERLIRTALPLPGSTTCSAFRIPGAGGRWKKCRRYPERESPGAWGRPR